MDIALVGIGKIARDQHIPAIAASSRFNLAATVSRQAAGAGVDHFTDFAQFLTDRPEVRVVSLCLPPVPRFAYAQAAIRSGRHVMLEKPPGAGIAECHALAQLAAQHRVTLFATWHSREAAMVGPAQAWLADKRLSRVQITWKEDVRRWHPGQTWIWEPGGLGVFDPGINALSIVTRILPRPLRVQAADLSFPENRATPIAADLQMADADGVPVHAAFDWRQTGPQTWTITVETTAGTLQLEDGGAVMRIDGTVTAAGAEDTLSGEYPRLYAQMADLIAAGQSDADFTPLLHVADAFLLGRRTTVAPFHDPKV